MFSDKTMFLLHKQSVILYFLAVSAGLFCPPVFAAEELSYARMIRQYVNEDKVYLLENIRQKVTRPSEITVINALLCEDGPQAVELYRKQLAEYPDPELDQLSTARIAAYQLALNSTAPLPRLSIPGPSTKLRFPSLRDSARQSDTQQSPLPVPARLTLKQEKSVAGPANFFLRFGSFENLQNAENLANNISLYEPAEIIRQGGINKVQLKKAFATKESAAATAKMLPFDSIVVPAR